MIDPTDISDGAKVVIRKSDFIPSRPWHADVVFEDGGVFRGWAEFQPTRKSIVDHVRSIAPSMEIEYA